MNDKPMHWQLDETADAGLHRVGRSQVEALCEAGRAAGLYCARLDLTDCRGKADLLASLARVLEFPSWFGHNWDALADCLDDLEWLRGAGYLLVLDNPAGMSAAAPKDFAVALDILADAARKWRERGTPFWVFLVEPGGE
ncbi:MAG TPA: barstar family protein [Lysobacter sp.]|nr:barstar family protein [Lysobacter sp.]